MTFITFCCLVTSLCKKCIYVNRVLYIVFLDLKKSVKNFEKLIFLDDDLAYDKQ